MKYTALANPMSFAIYLKGARYLHIIILFIVLAEGSFSQEQIQYSDFGFHSGFYFEGERIDKCKTYYDSSLHVLFNPCYDFRNRGIYSSYLARRVFLGDCRDCDSVSILLNHKRAYIDWEDLQHRQQETWDYYYRLWQKQDKLEKYYIDLEGIVRGTRPGPF